MLKQKEKEIKSMVKEKEKLEHSSNARDMMISAQQQKIKDLKHRSKSMKKH